MVLHNKQSMPWRYKGEFDGAHIGLITKVDLNVQCTLYSDNVYIIQCTHYTMYDVHCTLYNVHYVLEHWNEVINIIYFISSIDKLYIRNIT